MFKKANPRSRRESTPAKTQTPKAERIKLAVDVHMENYVFSRQIDGAAPQPPQRMARLKFQSWVLTQLTQAKEVHLCYEAGCFGFHLARELQAQGIKVYVIAPQSWAEKNQKSDKIDTRAMALRLEQYLNGHKHAFCVVRIPSVSEELARSESRQREQMLGHRKALQAEGRTLLLLHGHVLRGAWWQEGYWQRLRPTLGVEVAALLERQRGVLLVLEEKIAALTQRLQEAALGRRIPAGLGAMSSECLQREICDYGRFHNPRQVSSYTGMCPGENSSGPRRCQLSIHKHGNPQLRFFLIEAAWRLLRFQPEYWAVKKWRERTFAHPNAGASARKKAIVALARLLIVDLWKLETGRASAERLGLKMVTVGTSSATEAELVESSAATLNRPCLAA